MSASWVTESLLKAKHLWRKIPKTPMLNKKGGKIPETFLCFFQKPLYKSKIMCYNIVTNHFHMEVSTNGIQDQC
jgi:hypothetical protein